MRLIDADALKRNFEANTPVFAQDLVPGICAIIDLARTIDAVPVERCKNFWYPCVPNDDWEVCATGERKGRKKNMQKVIIPVSVDYGSLKDELEKKDIVRVIRCKDCKHHEDEENGMVYCSIPTGGWIKEDWFCGDGERKES